MGTGIFKGAFCGLGFQDQYFEYMQSNTYEQTAQFMYAKSKDLGMSNSEAQVQAK